MVGIKKKEVDMKNNRLVVMLLEFVLGLMLLSGCEFFFPRVELLERNSVDAIVNPESNTEVHQFTKVTLIAGSSDGTLGSHDGIGNNASFHSPWGITSDNQYIFITDTWNHTIRRIDKNTQEVMTIAGSPGISGSVDGIGNEARFYDPAGITTDDSLLYVADYTNFTIRTINKKTMEVSTIAGTAGLGLKDDGVGIDARFQFPWGITNDKSFLYIADTYNFTIRKIDKITLEVSTIAGDAWNPGSMDGIGRESKFSIPYGITNDEDFIYVIDSNNHTIRRIDKKSHKVVTIAGSAGISGYADGIGTEARFQFPWGITNDELFLYISDYGNHTIRRFEKATGRVDTIAGLAGSNGNKIGIPQESLFYHPRGIVIENSTLYIVDSGNNAIKKIE